MRASRILTDQDGPRSRAWTRRSSTVAVRVFVLAILALLLSSRSALAKTYTVTTTADTTVTSNCEPA